MTEQIGAFFDLDGTLANSNVVRSYHYLIQRLGSPPIRALRVARLALAIPFYLVLDHFDRSTFNIVFNRRYRPLLPDDVRRLAAECAAATIAERANPHVMARLLEHRRQGHKVFLITGSLELFVEKFAADLDLCELVGTRLDERNGRFTGRLRHRPIVGGQKATIVRDLAVRHGIDLEESYAYADSASDRPFLETVGHPCAVHPDKALKQLATTRGWEIIDKPSNERGIG